MLGEFKAGRSPIMLATDVAARGLDVPDVRCPHCALFVPSLCALCAQYMRACWSACSRCVLTLCSLSKVPLAGVLWGSSRFALPSVDPSCALWRFVACRQCGPALRAVINFDFPGRCEECAKAPAHRHTERQTQTPLHIPLARKACTRRLPRIETT